MRSKLNDHPILILGTNGNIARELALKFPAARVVPRSEYLTWLEEGTYSVNSFLRNLKTNPKVIFNCIGVTNPAENESLLLKLNYELPKLLISSVADVETTIVTFGTVMENLRQYAHSNNYLKSKLLFHEWLHDQNRNDRFLHLQLHTLYGGNNIHQHMFLGQIFNALRKQEKFSMSSGIQIREYHHIEDDVSAALEIVNQGLSGVLPISHGNPEKLRDLAHFIFSYFDCLNLLEIGKVKASEFDSMRPISQVNHDFLKTQFRDTKTGIIGWLSANL